MGYKSVIYRKQVEAGGGAGDSVSVEDGVKRIKSLAGVKVERKYKGFKKRKTVDQTVELVLHLGIDPRQADQMVRGAISLPKGIGKARRVIAFCDGDMAEEAKAAGAIEAGGVELVDKIQ